MAEDKQGEGPVGLLQVIASVGAAFFGVQKAANRERDFTRGKPHHFIIAGLLGAVVVVLLLVGLVRLVMYLAVG